MLTVKLGNLRQLNELARNAKADYILHTGDFGFYDDSSLDRIAEKYVTLKRARSVTANPSIGPSSMSPSTRRFSPIL